MIQFRVAFLSTFLLAFLKPSQSYIITVDARAQDCYHAKVEAGTKMGMLLERLRCVGKIEIENHIC